jgi:outer membrane receptor protein involved in Fe transport
MMLAAAFAALLPAAFAPRNAAADEDAPMSMQHDSTKYEVVVSATRRISDPVNIPNATSVVRGTELRRRGAHTLADALLDLVGLDTGDGSDNGMRLPNIGMWGLKEFDALLITLDGVPVGGPFNPSLAQIPIEDIDRLEVVKGPQGTLYGVSAFAGMVQVFTRTSEDGRGHITGGGGSFSDVHGDAAFKRSFANGVGARLTAAARHSDGWQERTGSEIGRVGLLLSKNVGKADMSLDLIGLDDDQKWGTPIPYDSGEPLPGFVTDANYAVRGAHQEHQVLSAVSHFGVAVAKGHRFENTLSFTRDDQTSIRSFPDAVSGDTVTSAGVKLEPRETSIYEDARWLSDFRLAGDHQLVGGAAVTYGRTTASGIGFDFDQRLSDRSSIPDLSTIPVGDNRSFEDKRTFIGVYAHDEWTPAMRFTLSGGGRYDNASEKLHAFGQEVGDPVAAISDDSKTTGAWSGDIAALVRLAPAGAKALEALNVYANFKSSFKPAAPNLTEAEDAEILEPERSHSLEGGLKARAFDRQVALDFTWFQMDFENMVVSNLDTLGNPQLLNAGHERFKGQEVDLTLSPAALPGLSLNAGYAHHDPRFVQFTFVAPDGQFRDVSGKFLELAPRDMFNVKLAYQDPRGIGAWIATHRQGVRALTRRNTFFADAFTEYDAGASCEFGKVLLTVAGRNLGDDRHVVGESDIGDSQFYLAAPRRVNAEVTFRF